MLKKIAAYTLVFALLIVAAGCGSEDNGPVASVNGVEIPWETFDMEFQYELTMYQQDGTVLKESEKEQIKLLVVDRLINNILLRDAVEDAGITADDVDVDGQLTEVMGRFDDEEEFNDALDIAGFSLEEYKLVIAEYLMIEELFESQLMLSEISVDEKDIQKEMDYLVENYEGDDLDVEELREFVEHTLKQDKAEELRSLYIDQLRSDSDIEYFDF